MIDLSGNVLRGYGVSLMPVQEIHLEQLRHWRNDPAVSQFMLTQEEITPEQQLDWFKHIAVLDSQQHFVIVYKEQLIGAANIKEQQQMPIVNTKHKENLRVEPGIYLGDEKFRNNVLAFAPSLLLLDYCFERLKLQKLFATVHKDNEAALNYNQKLGYSRVAAKDNWVSIELTVQNYCDTAAAMKQFLSKRTKLQ